MLATKTCNLCKGDLGSETLQLERSHGEDYTMCRECAAYLARQALARGWVKARPRLGVAVVVDDGHGRVLLGRRGKEPNYGLWVVPGGGVKPGESFVDTARREVREETGLDLEIVPAQARVLAVREVISGDGPDLLDEDREHRVILFLQVIAPPVPVRASSDLLEARFFARDEIPVSELSPVVAPVLRELGWIE